MSRLPLLSEVQMRRLRRFFPKLIVLEIGCGQSVSMSPDHPDMLA